MQAGGDRLAELLVEARLGRRQKEGTALARQCVILSWIVDLCQLGSHSLGGHISLLKVADADH